MPSDLPRATFCALNEVPRPVSLTVIVCRRGKGRARNGPGKGHGRGSSDENQAEKLVAALCERLAEVLPKSKFEVTGNRHAIWIRGIG